jgi:hypothetical protein
MVTLATGVFLGVLRLTRDLPRSTFNWLALLIVACLGFYIQQVFYDLRLARWLPTSALIVVGNWLPILAMALAALAWRTEPPRSIRRFIPVAVLGTASLSVIIYPLLGSPPRCQAERWDSFGNCLQTTEYTCSPAAAATVLRAHGIQATEQEMAELCLTRRGTTWPGLYRGLKLKTAGTKWDVEVLSGEPYEWDDLEGRPIILSVGLSREARVDANFSAEFGWVPGVNHSVVLWKLKPSGRATITDPTQPHCRENWEPDMLHLLYRGCAMRLVERR